MMPRYSAGMTGYKRLLARHDGSLWAAAKHSAQIRMFRQPMVRSLARLVVPVKTPKRWIFVVGCYNSGTKLLTQLIASHPSVASMPQEGRFFTDAFPDLQADGWRRMMFMNRDKWNMPDAQDEKDRIKKRALADWSPLWNSTADSAAFLEKSICHTTRVGWMNEVFRQGETYPTFVHIVRDGYATANSVRQTGQPIGKAAQETGGRYSIELAAQQWAALNQAVLDDADHLSHYHRVRFEDLVDDPASVMTQLFSDIELDLPRINIDPDGISIAGDFHEVRGGLNRKRIDTLKSEEKAAIEPIISDLMQVFGYD